MFGRLFIRNKKTQLLCAEKKKNEERREEGREKRAMTRLYFGESVATLVAFPERQAAVDSSSAASLSSLCFSF